MLYNTPYIAKTRRSLGPRKPRAHHELRSASMAAARARAYPCPPTPPAPESAPVVESPPKARRLKKINYGSPLTLPPRDARPGAFTPSKRRRVYERDWWKCVWCGKSWEDATFDLDHLVPVIRGGCDVEQNLVLSCKRCNQAKSGEAIDGIHLNEHGDRPRFVEWDVARAHVRRLRSAWDENKGGYWIAGSFE